jgi:nicotinamide mononucleotide (NMN) deamidase PncC
MKVPAPAQQAGLREPQASWTIESSARFRDPFMPDALRDSSNRLLQAAKAAGPVIAVAESCTAGLLCQGLADAEGAGTQFEFNYGDLGRDAVRARAVADALQALTDTVAAVSAAA